MPRTYKVVYFILTVKMFAFYFVASGLLSRNLTILFYIFPTLVSDRYSTVIIMKRRLCLLVSIFLYWGYFCTPGELLWYFIVDQQKSWCASLLTVHVIFSFMGACWWHDSMILSHPDLKAFFVTASIIFCNNKYFGLCLLSVYSII